MLMSTASSSEFPQSLLSFSSLPREVSSELSYSHFSFPLLSKFGV